jgi:hypothetical protein
MKIINERKKGKERKGKCGDKINYSSLETKCVHALKVTTLLCGEQQVLIWSDLYLRPIKTK